MGKESGSSPASGKGEWSDAMDVLRCVLRIDEMGEQLIREGVWNNRAMERAVSG
jgi:hypothetical protein